MNRTLIRRLPIALAGLAVLLFVATAAVGATPKTITLSLLAGVNQGMKTACHETNHYQAYKINTRMRSEGYVIPAPPFPDQAWKVKIKIEKCVLGHFVVIAQPHVLGNGVLVNGVKEGHFRFSRVNRALGFYFLRAYYYTTPTTSIQSTDEHFHVTR